MKFIETWVEDSKNLKETQITSESVYKGVLLDARADSVRLPNGKQSRRENILHPGASVVLPVFNDGNILLLGQYRYPLKSAFLELPAGKLDPGESAESTAVRELKEEAGLTCGSLKKIGHFHPCIGYSDEIIHLYIGWDLKQEEANTDDDEFLNRYKIHFRQALEMVHLNQITDSKTVIGLLRGWHWWEKNRPFQI